MSDGDSVTKQDLQDMEARMISRQTTFETHINARQKDYEEQCETDRKEIREEQASMKAVVARIEEKQDKSNAMVESLTNAFKGVLSQPRVQAAMMSLIIALAGYLTYKLHSLTPSQIPVVPQQIIVIPSYDAGTQ